MMMMSESSRVASGPGVQAVVVKLPAEIDVSDHGQVRDALTRPLRNGRAIVVADASETTFCDCAGVRALARAHHQAIAAGVQVRVVVSPAVRRILTLTGMGELLRTYPSVPAALLADGGAEQVPDAVGEGEAERSADDQPQDGAADVAPA